MNDTGTSSRWYIEPPDFAFHGAEPEQQEPQPPEAPAENGHSLLPQAQLLPGPQDDPANLFESPTYEDDAAAPIAAPAPAIITPAAIEPPVLRPAPRPQLYPLAGLRALSEEEVIALFS